MVGTDKCDRILLSCSTASALYGLLLVSSAVKSTGGISNIIVQSVAIVLGLIIMMVLSNIDYNALLVLHTPVMLVSLLMLVVVLLIGIGGAETGTTGWIRVGPLSIQPSEFAKVGFILTFAHHLSSKQRVIEKFSTLMGLCLHAGAFIGLVLLQPDYGTAMVFIFIAVVMMFYAGVRIRYFVAGGLAFIASLPLFWYFILDEFQKQRILVFLNPESSPMGAGYNVIQSKIAVGAGMIFGKGVFKGTQVQLGFIPGRHTDFIFAVAGEELGFFGCLVIIALLGTIIYRLLRGAERVRIDGGSFILMGIAAMLIFQCFENIGMCIGIMPCTGIPLPFFSYGGSSILTNFISIGIALSIIRRRDYI